MKFEGIRISDLKPGETVNGIYILKNAELKVSSNKKTYIDIIFTDQTGEVIAKWWDSNESEFTSLAVNKLYYVNARVDLWREALQMSIGKMKLADEEDQNRISEYVQSAPLLPSEMLDQIYFFVTQIKSSEMRNLIMHMLANKEEHLMYYPAAKSLHHAIRSGLLYHILRMLKSAEAICHVYEGINTDLLYAGVILHDLAKIGEMEANELGIAEYTKEGQLLGHIIIGIEELDRAGRELGVSQEILLLLKHMILSHHYEAEYGSPKKPHFLEAELLHHIDLIDARVYDYQNATRNTQEGSFSEPVWSLDRRMVYKPMTGQMK